MLTVNSVKYAGAYKLYVSLSNGQTGLFDVSGYTQKGFFKELANEDYLKQVAVDRTGMGICWPNEQDLSANTLAAALIDANP